DLPKWVLNTITFPGLMPDESVNPKVAALLGLNSEEESALVELDQKMRQRFEEAERAHFTRVEPGSNKFILRAFPDEGAEIRNRWSIGVNELLGESRGIFLQRSFQTDWINYLAENRDRELLARYIESKRRLTWAVQPWTQPWKRGTQELHFAFNCAAGLGPSG